MKFKKGDKVKCMEEHSGMKNIVGMTGTVIVVGPIAIGVRFDMKMGGHDLGGGCPNGYGWNIPEHKLILIDCDWEQRIRGGLNDT
jgi:hypothetical protein